MSVREQYFIRTRKRWLQGDWIAYYGVLSDVKATGMTEQQAVQNLIIKLDAEVSIAKLGIANCKLWLHDHKVAP